MSVIKIHGVNGSGKSTLARAFLEHFDFRVEKFEHYTSNIAKIPEESKLFNCGVRRLVVLGKYNVACGGLDTIVNQEAKMAALKKYARNDTLVVIEGILPSTTYGEMGKFSEQLGQKGNWLYVFLNTPFEICVDRIIARRLEKGNFKDFDPNRSMAPKIKAIEAVKRKAEERGQHVVTINHQYSAKHSMLSLVDCVAKKRAGVM